MFTKQRYVIRSIAKMIEEGWSEDDARRIAYDAVGEVDAENANAPVDLAQSPNLDHYLKNCPVLDHMHKYGRPLTRETYIALATLGQDEDYHWDHEDEVDVPEPLKDLDEFDPEPRPDKPLKLYEVWNTETHRLGALISAPNLKGAIKEARKAARLYDNMVYSSAKMSVRVAVPENITTEAQKSITQYGYWYAYASAGARCMDDIAEPAADFQHAQDTTKAS